jgi:hypothetical protein
MGVVQLFAKPKYEVYVNFCQSLIIVTVPYAPLSPPKR